MGLEDWAFSASSAGFRSQFSICIEETNHRTKFIRSKVFHMSMNWLTELCALSFNKLKYNLWVSHGLIHNFTSSVSRYTIYKNNELKQSRQYCSMYSFAIYKCYINSSPTSISTIEFFSKIAHNSSLLIKKLTTSKWLKELQTHKVYKSRSTRTYLAMAEITKPPRPDFHRTNYCMSNELQSPEVVTKSDQTKKKKP